MLFILCLFSAQVTLPSGLAQETNSRLTNRDVLAMVSLGLSDEVIIDKLNATKDCDFDTSVDGLKALKAGNVSDRVIRAMINSPSTTTPATRDEHSPLIDDSREPSEAGVFLATKGKLVEIDPEIVGWQTGGVLKKTVTLGLDKGHVNGKVMRPQSALQVTTPVEFVIRTLEGTSVSEFQLLRLYEKGNRREFRAVTGGILHVKGGSERNDIGFTPEKTGTRTWHIRISHLAVGEYGFLPPGLLAASIGSSGKIYTFGVTEGGQSQSDARAREIEGRSPDEGPDAATNYEEGSIGAEWAGDPDVRHDGVTVSSVLDGGPAAQAGIKVGDVILAVGGTYVFTGRDLTRVVSGLKPGTRVVIHWRHLSAMYGNPVYVSRKNAN